MKGKNKIVVIGAGNVGVNFAFCTLVKNNRNIKEIVLIDLNINKAEGEAMDLSHCIPYLNSNIVVKFGDYSECKDADFVVITAGAANCDKVDDRLELASVDAKIVKEITENVVESGFSGIFITATNPVDLMNYVVKRVSKFNFNKVIGTGVLLDTIRYRYLLSKKLNISVDKVDILVLGEHGNSAFPVLSRSYVDSVNILDWIKENGINKEKLYEIFQEVKEIGPKIACKKGNTCYGIAMTIYEIIEAIILDKKIILPVSTNLDGKYKKDDISIGVPCIIGKNGIEEIKEIRLNNEELFKFEESYNILNKVKKESILNNI